MKRMWKINAGRRSVYADRFRDENLVAIGWRECGDYSSGLSRLELVNRVRSAYPDRTDQQVTVAVGQIWRFLTDVDVGDLVTTYDPNTRMYMVGNIAGIPEFRPSLIEQLPVIRRVEWVSEKSRDELSRAAKGNLGAILTIFLVSEVAQSELLNVALDDFSKKSIAETLEIEDVTSSIDPYEQIDELAIERTKDRLKSLDWEEMQEIVASLLRSLGYRTVISPTGPDRGKDIVASRDGFGFERPRIIVEVKHRSGAMGEPEIRSFIGGRHADDRGLYVSTGGFTREAQYEAERASTVTHLMTLDGLARAILDNYEDMDERGKALLPLMKIYWPK
jgi:restriction system protein